MSPANIQKSATSLTRPTAELTGDTDHIGQPRAN